MVLPGADAPFSGEGSVNTGGNKLDREGNAAEIGAEGLGRFIVHDELGKGYHSALQTPLNALSSHH